MLLWESPSTDPTYNLAMEEVFFTRKTEEMVFLWRNAPSVIVGVNQNTAAEVNAPFLAERGIPVVRRLTGGGAVYHDLGNINFSFLQRCPEQPALGRWEAFTRPVRDYLCRLGVRAELQGRNDIAVDGRKISGNAQAVRQGRILHHGTLLYQADTADIAQALRVRRIKWENKGIRSVSARVANIADFLESPPPAQDFLAGLYAYFAAMDGVQEYTPSAEEEQEARQLQREKYRTWEWNYGRSPACGFTVEQAFPSGLVEAGLTLENGRIARLRIRGDFFGLRPAAELERALEGTPFAAEELAARLDALHPEEYIHGVSAREFLALLLYQERDGAAEEEKGDTDEREREGY